MPVLTWEKPSVGSRKCNFDTKVTDVMAVLPLGQSYAMRQVALLMGFLVASPKGGLLVRLRRWPFRRLHPGRSRKVLTKWWFRWMLEKCGWNSLEDDYRSQVLLELL
ncbi:hypothetical protein GH714_003203 [Hevea brasiliensis]|uniref:Uncharacterized protein n=1 Tax=Hevea brasiliensis TaxID=3981 RepID=A0A6A6LXH9_HEVBR|nr:hypothetical protein GH714_003203 [Hevea brasiliensis]